MSTVGLILFGIGVGVLSGTFGIGGGIILVPGLVLLFGFSQLEAQGTSLAVLTVPICLFAAVVYYQNGYLRLPAAGWIAFGFVAGAFGGAKLAPQLPVTIVRVGFALLLLYVGLEYLYEALARGPLTRSRITLGLGAMLLAAASATLMRLRKSSAPISSDDLQIDYHI